MSKNWSAFRDPIGYKIVGSSKEEKRNCSNLVKSLQEVEKKYSSISDMQGMRGDETLESKEEQAMGDFASAYQSFKKKNLEARKELNVQSDISMIDQGDIQEFDNLPVVDTSIVEEVIQDGRGNIEEGGYNEDAFNYEEDSYEGDSQQGINTDTIYDDSEQTYYDEGQDYLNENDLSNAKGFSEDEILSDDFSEEYQEVSEGVDDFEDDSDGWGELSSTNLNTNNKGLLGGSNLGGLGFMENVLLNNNLEDTSFGLSERVIKLNSVLVEYSRFINSYNFISEDEKRRNIENFYKGLLEMEVSELDKK